MKTHMEREHMPKKPRIYPVKRIFLETLSDYIEAARCKTLDQFQTPEWKEKLGNAIKHEGGE